MRRRAAIRRARLGTPIRRRVPGGRVRPGMGRCASRRPRAFGRRPPAAGRVGPGRGAALIVGPGRGVGRRSIGPRASRSAPVRRRLGLTIRRGTPLLRPGVRFRLSRGAAVSRRPRVRPRFGRRTPVGRPRSIGTSRRARPGPSRHITRRRRSRLAIRRRLPRIRPRLRRRAPVRGPPCLPIRRWRLRPTHIRRRARLPIGRRLARARSSRRAAIRRHRTRPTRRVRPDRRFRPGPGRRTTRRRLRPAR
jgi:hypothetical protein